MGTGFGGMFSLIFFGLRGLLSEIKEEDYTGGILIGEPDKSKKSTVELASPNR